MNMTKCNEKATDWGAIYTKQLKKRAKSRYEYDILQGHGIGAYDRLQEQKLSKLHQFYVEFEQKHNSKKKPVRFIG